MGMDGGGGGEGEAAAAGCKDDSPLTARLESKAWKTRMEAYIELAEVIYFFLIVRLFVRLVHVLHPPRFDG